MTQPSITWQIVLKAQITDHGAARQIAEQAQILFALHAKVPDRVTVAGEHAGERRPQEPPR